MIIKDKNYSYFIGIDVSKNKLDYSVIQKKDFLFHRETENQPEAILAFINVLKTLPGFKLAKALFCLEHTGIYSNHLLACLHKLKARIVVENSLHIKNSSGLIRNKYDKIDSLRIATYALKNKDDLRLWAPKRPVIVQLSHLATLENRLLSLQVALSMPLKEQAAFSSKASCRENKLLCQNSRDAIKADLLKIGARIKSLVDTDERLKRLWSIITSVPGVGKKTALHMIIATNEFKAISDPKKFACYAGVAPFVKESGMFKGKRKVSGIANKKMKSLLHLCAMSLLNTKNELKAYYTRKTTIEGKHKMAVINAVRNKIVLRIFACINQDRLYEAQYNNKHLAVANNPL